MTGSEHVRKAACAVEEIRDADEFTRRATDLFNYATPEEDRAAGREVVRPTNVTIAGGSVSAVLYSLTRSETERLRETLIGMMRDRRAEAVSIMRAEAEAAVVAIHKETK